MAGAVDRVVEMEEESEAPSRKRVAEPDVETLHQAEGQTRPSAKVSEVPGEHDLLLTSVLGQDTHPLRLLQEQADRERQDPASYVVEDHGTWHGCWPLPSRTEWNARHRHCLMWPKGSHEVTLVQASRREYKWKEIAAEDKQAFRDGAKTGWPVWVDNGAVEILSKAEAEGCEADFDEHVKPTGYWCHDSSTPTRTMD